MSGPLLSKNLLYRLSTHIALELFPSDNIPENREQAKIKVYSVVQKEIGKPPITLSKKTSLALSFYQELEI